MTALRARFAAAVVIVTTAAAVLAGCGSGGKSSAHSTPSAERPAASVPGIGPDGTAEDSGSTAGSGGATAKAPTLPKSRITPATGTFTDAQKNYLVGKVTAGLDPSAVLQTGQESCERIANTADASQKLAKEAIASGEIADARDAITYLCPKYANLLH